MNVKNVNSIIFHCKDLQKNRDFYAGLLNLKVGTYEKNGEVVVDESSDYVNFHLEGTLLCFEKGKSVETGTIILNVDDLDKFKSRLLENNVSIEKDSPQWLIFKDPDGRTIILEPIKDKGIS